ncbi:MBL fold metallo-hydrolase, partial [Candidatus Dojkabacteria bacterium]|nr:MBL fold metallo-hydrolase [Candidatus Dojkabacteria bacterium]
MTIQFLGAAKTVTGSCFYVKTDNTKFLVDCGAFQGPLELEKRNYEPFPFDPAELDYVFLTHAHYDHCGRLPVLVKQGFRGRIFCTQPTRDLARV